MGNHKEIQELENQLIDLTEKKIDLERALNLMLDEDKESFQPSIKDVENWKEFGYQDAIPIFEEQEGKLLMEEEGKFDRIRTTQKFNEFDDFCNWYVFQLKLEDWLSFYRQLIRWRKNSIDRLSLRIKKLRLPQNPLAPEEKIELVEENYRRLGKDATYDKAIRLANEKAKQILYKNYESFKASRNRLNRSKKK